MEPDVYIVWNIDQYYTSAVIVKTYIFSLR